MAFPTVHCGYYGTSNGGSMQQTHSGQRLPKCDWSYPCWVVIRYLGEKDSH
jgi:hypothetical protein